jgi:hypothetical protein
MSAQRTANRTARRRRTQELQRLLRELKSIPAIYNEEDGIAACADAVDAHDRRFASLRRDVQRIVDSTFVTEIVRVEITSRLYDLAFEIHTLKQHVRESVNAFYCQAASIATLQAQMAGVTSAMSSLMTMIRRVDHAKDVDAPCGSDHLRGIGSEGATTPISMIKDGNA